MVGHWNSFTREVVTALSFPEFRSTVWTVLSDVWSDFFFLGGGDCPVWSQELDMMILMGLFQRGKFYDSEKMKWVEQIFKVVTKQ